MENILHSMGKIDLTKVLLINFQINALGIIIPPCGNNHRPATNGTIFHQLLVPALVQLKECVVFLAATGAGIGEVHVRFILFYLQN